VLLAPALIRACSPSSRALASTGPVTDSICPTPVGPRADVLTRSGDAKEAVVTGPARCDQVGGAVAVLGPALLPAYPAESLQVPERGSYGRLGEFRVGSQRPHAWEDPDLVLAERVQVKPQAHVVGIGWQVLSAMKQDRPDGEFADLSLAISQAVLHPVRKAHAASR
jgi:hypothetical protein